MLTRRRTFVLALGLACFVACWIAGDGSRAARAGGVALWMAVWWIGDALPIHVTALVPLVAFPLLRTLPGTFGENLRAIATAYVDPYIFLFLGGMAISAAMRQWGLSRRIALWILVHLAPSSARLLLGVLLATAVVSMWISNTATAAMMLPIALSLVHHVEEKVGARLEWFGGALVLAVAYGASIGGIATVVGTPTNAQLSGFASRQGVEIDFARFALVGGGFTLLFLPLAWGILWRTARRDAPPGRIGVDVVREEWRALGPLSRGEARILGVFAVAVVGWVAAGPIARALAASVDFVTLRNAHVEAAIGVLAGVVLLVWRVDGRALCGRAALRETPWSTLLLLGGSFALAVGVGGSGLFESIGGALAWLRELPLWPQCVVAATAAVVASATASNTATIGVLLPILWNAVPIEHAPAVTFAATIACSCDFMMPAGTPPNAIVFGSGRVTLSRMASTGFVLDLLGAALAGTWCALVVPWVVRHATT